jgi:quercetin dioxygenase-like cupin family protein
MPDQTVKVYSMLNCTGGIAVMRNNPAARSFVLTAGLLFAAGAGAAGSAAFVPAAEARWGNVPDAPGVQIAPLQGDPGKGPSHFFHTANHYVTVLAGTVVLVVDGKEHRFGPGSYFSFAGKKTHATRCEAGTDCVLAMDVRGPWDVVPAAKAGAR